MTDPVDGTVEACCQFIRAGLRRLLEAIHGPSLFDHGEIGTFEVFREPDGRVGVRGTWVDVAGDGDATEKAAGFQPSKPGHESKAVVFGAYAYGVDQAQACDAVGELIQGLGVEGEALVLVVISPNLIER